MIYKDGKRTADFADALFKLLPTSKWRIEGDPTDYKNIKWESTDIDRPSEDILLTTVKSIQIEWDQIEYLNQRKKEYPDWRDLADAIYWQHKGDLSKMDAYLLKVEAVKLKYPK